MMILFVGGTWDEEGGRPSSLVDTFASSIDSDAVNVHNGGYFDDLRNIIQTATMYDIVFWWANVSNDFTKIRNVKEINPKCLLVTSKRNDDEKYSFSELINMSLGQKANLTVEFSKKDDMFNMRVFDPLGTLWYEGTDIERCMTSTITRLEYLKMFTRVSSMSVGEKVPAPNDDDFFDYVKECAEKFHEIINPAKEVTRFLGNSSFRCERGFPSFRTTEGAFVSKRNVDKRFIGKDEFILTQLNENGKVCYYGEAKPSVDTPVQLRLYNFLPEINYMIHAHCYVEGGIFTSIPIPCGAIEEVNEVLEVIDSYCTNKYQDSYAINLIGHGCIIMGRTVDHLKKYSFYARQIPEKVV